MTWGLDNVLNGTARAGAVSVGHLSLHKIHYRVDVGLDRTTQRKAALLDERVAYLSRTTLVCNFNSYELLDVMPRQCCASTVNQQVESGALLHCQSKG